MDATLRVDCIKGIVNTSIFRIQRQDMHRMLQCLHRIGDDVFVEPMTDKLLLSSVSSSKSAFACFTLNAQYFDKYVMHTTHSEDKRVRVKLLIKPLLNVFRLKMGLERHVERCAVQLQSDDAAKGHFLRIEFHCRFGIVKTHKLNFQSVESVLHARVNGSILVNKWTVTPNILTLWMSYFDSQLDEVTMSAGPHQHTPTPTPNAAPKIDMMGGDDDDDDFFDVGYIRFKSYSNSAALFTQGSRTNHRPLATELQLDPMDFEVFTVTSDSGLSFNMREFKGILALAEGLKNKVSAQFADGGLPICFTLAHGEHVECKFVLSTASCEDEDDDVKVKQQQKHTQKQQPSSNVNSTPPRRFSTAVPDFNNVQKEMKSQKSPSEFSVIQSRPARRPDFHQDLDSAAPSQQLYIPTQKLDTPHQNAVSRTPNESFETVIDPTPRMLDNHQEMLLFPDSDREEDEEGNDDDDDEEIPATPPPPNKKFKSLFSDSE